MTFEEHWNKVLAGNPALSSTFARPLAEAAWQEAFRDGYEKGVAAFHEAVTMEREACAKIVESCTSLDRAWKERGECVIAGAIRARSNVELTGAAPLYGAASSDRRERG